MIIQKAEVRCVKCNHDFNIDMPVKCEIEVFSAAMKAVKCPKCNAESKYIALVTARLKFGNEVHSPLCSRQVAFNHREQGVGDEGKGNAASGNGVVQAALINACLRSVS